MDKGHKVTPVAKFFGNPDELTVREIELAKRSASTKRRIRAEARIRRGLHPFGLKLLEPAGKQCGDCRFAERHRRYAKCEKFPSGGPATDLRLRWAACELFVQDEKKEPDEHEDPKK